MPTQKTDDDIAEQIIRQQREQEVEAQIKEAKEARRQRIEEAKERIRARTYTVQAGDTLGKIAQQHYGSAGKYTVIFEANKPMLKDPDKIYPGQSLRIPAL